MAVPDGMGTQKVSADTGTSGIQKAGQKRKKQMISHAGGSACGRRSDSERVRNHRSRDGGRVCSHRSRDGGRALSYRSRDDGGHAHSHSCGRDENGHVHSHNRDDGVLERNLQWSDSGFPGIRYRLCPQSKLSVP